MPYGGVLRTLFEVAVSYILVPELEKRLGNVPVGTLARSRNILRTLLEDEGFANVSPSVLKRLVLAAVDETIRATREEDNL